MSEINFRSTEATSQTATQTKTREKKGSDLDKDDFLKLLVAQLRHQDPLNPMEDKDFIAQTAQFSSLEQMKNLNTTIATTSAMGMIGKQINFVDNKTGTVYTGVVNSVSIKDSEPYLIIKEGDVTVAVKLDTVVAVGNPGTEKSTDKSSE